MVKTQVHVPDELYGRAKEWSLAEVFRRGLEDMASAHQTDGGGEWKLLVLDCDKKLVATMRRGRVECDY